MPITKKELARRLALETDNSKYCCKCKKIKPLFEFDVSGRERKNSKTWCRDCHTKDQRERNHDITMEEYRELLEQQCGKCGICGTTTPGGWGTFHIDHDHKIENKRDSIRGLLCNNCNRGLGHFKDNPESLIAAAAYLLKHKGKK